MKLRLHAGEGSWYSLFKNGAIYHEGNKEQMKEFLKQHTKYSTSKINDLINRSTTEWLDVNLKEELILRQIIREEIKSILQGATTK